MIKMSRFWSRKNKQHFSQILQDKPSRAKAFSSQPKLLIITQFFPPDYAATGQLIQELADNLAKNQLEVSIFTGQPSYAYSNKQAPIREIKNNLNIRRSKTVQICSSRIRAKTINGIIFTLRSAWHILRNGRQYDTIILTTAPPFLAFAGYLSNLFWGTQYICLIYDLYPDVVVELGVVSQNHLITKFWHYFNRIIWQKAKAIIVLSKTMKQRIIAKHSTVAHKIAVIHNWSDADWIKPLPKKDNWFACQHGIDRQFTVLYSGNMGRCHDLETIFGAIKLLRNQPIKFVFIGAGAKYEPLQEAVSKSQLNNCIFLPYQEKNHLPYSLTACDLALVSIAEGLEGVVAPSKLYGIMAAGKAIAAVCEPHSYLRSVVGDAQCGQCFSNGSSVDLADFILSLAINPKLSVNMGNAGRRYMIDNFTPQIIARQYCQVLDLASLEQDTHVQQPDFANEEVRVS